MSIDTLTVAVKRKGTGATLYSARVQRDTSVYPRTPDGEIAFESAASNGAFDLIVDCDEGGTVTIPAGTKPPITKPSCTPTTPPDPGGGTTTPIGGSGFISYTNQNLTGIAWLQNSKLKIGFDGDVGFCLTDVYDLERNGGENLVNTVLKGGVRDKGRSIQFGSDYFTPGRGYQVAGRNTRDFGYDTGGNTVQGGNMESFLQKSNVLSSAIVNPGDGRGNVFCARIQPRVWGVPDVTGHITLDIEVWLSDRVVSYKTRHIVGNRPGDASNPEYTSRDQENPCIFAIAPMHYFYVTSGGSERFVDIGVQSGPRFSPNYFADNCRIGLYRDVNQQGFLLLTPGNSNFRFNTNDSYFGGANDQAASYGAAVGQMNYDIVSSDARQHYYDSGFIICGTKSECETIANTLPGPDQSLDFDFSKDNHRWWNGDCRMMRNGDKIDVYLGDAKVDNNVTSTRGDFKAPARAWIPENIPQIKFRFSSQNISQLQFIFEKTGQSGSTFFTYNFNVNSDGAEHEYTIPANSIGNWNGGRIAYFGLKGIDGGVTPNSGKISISRVWKP